MVSAGAFWTVVAVAFEMWEKPARAEIERSLVVLVDIPSPDLFLAGCTIKSKASKLMVQKFMCSGHIQHLGTTSFVRLSTSIEEIKNRDVSQPDVMLLYFIFPSLCPFLGAHLAALLLLMFEV